MGILQMTWQPGLHKSDKRKHGGPPLGLQNLGNSCYLNSVLQCLTYTPPLANFCLRCLHSSTCDLVAAKEKKGDCPFCILEKQISRSLSFEAALDAPVKINNCLRIYAKHFRPGRQEDAHEFLRYVIDACHNTCLKLKKLQQQQRARNGLVNGVDISGSGETVVKEIFGGTLQSQVKCLSCGAESNKVDEIMDLSLDILHSGSLKDALQKFFQPEILDGNNKYKCDNCKELVAARKQMSILEAPNVFVIQLKRFEGIFGGKVDKLIAFEEILVLSSYMCRASQDRHPEYNLFGTIVHSGCSSDSGHYYAYIKDASGRWYCCNDSYVSLSTMQEVLSEKVYILFFSRTKQNLRNRVGSTVNGPRSYTSNENKIPAVQKPNGVQKAASIKKVPSQKPETKNLTHLFETNGKKSSSVLRLGYSAKPFSANNISSNHCENIKSSNHTVPNGVKVATIQKLDSIETPVNNNGYGHHAGTNISATSLQKSCVPIEGNKKNVADNHTETSNSMKSKIDQGDSSSQRKFSISGNISIAVCERESKEDSGDAVAPAISTEKERTKSSVRNDACEESVDLSIPLNGKPLEICNGDNKPTTSDSFHGSFLENTGIKTKMESQSRVGYQDLQNGVFKSPSNETGLKRKVEQRNACILLETDAQSRAEVEAFKEQLQGEASLILKSCLWYEEVYSFTLANKKLCQQDDNWTLNDDENKKLLVAHAKQKFISKLPESLKGRLIEHLKLFSQGKQSSQT